METNSFRSRASVVKQLSVKRNVKVQEGPAVSSSRMSCSPAFVPLVTLPVTLYLNPVDKRRGTSRVYKNTYSGVENVTYNKTLTNFIHGNIKHLVFLSLLSFPLLFLQ
jgi:hypothetical protein